jgi:hypothetical protein
MDKGYSPLSPCLLSLAVGLFNLRATRARDDGGFSFFSCGMAMFWQKQEQLSSFAIEPRSWGGRVRRELLLGGGRDSWQSANQPISSFTITTYTLHIHTHLPSYSSSSLSVFTKHLKRIFFTKMTAAITHPESNGSAHVLPEGESSKRRRGRLE